MPSITIGPVPSLSGHAFAGTGSIVVLKVVPVTGTTFSGIIMNHFLCFSFPTPVTTSGGTVVVSAG